MSRLRDRIAGQPAAAAAAAAGYHPHGNADTPMMMPMVAVQVGPGGSYVQQMMPIITANGAPIAATAPGRYDQVVMSGAGRY